MVWFSKASQLALSLSTIFTRPAPPPPALLVEITPQFDADVTPYSIDVRMTVKDLQVPANTSLFIYYSNAPPNNYSSDQIQACDAQGTLSLFAEKADGQFGQGRVWKCSRSTEGGVTLEYRAFVQTNLGQHAPCVPPVTLGAEKNGFVGTGLAFLLQPVTDTDYNITYSWDLSAAPNATRVVCTFGERPKVSTVAKPSRLRDTVFAVGQLNSYPDETSRVLACTGLRNLPLTRLNWVWTFKSLLWKWHPFSETLLP
jgi:hypothetical protein